MGFKATGLLLGPLLIMLAIALFDMGASATALGGSGSVQFCQTQGCSSPSGSNVNVVTYQCVTQGFVPCKILPNCINPTPTPAWCFPWPLSLSPGDAGTFLNPGASLILTTGQIQQGQQAGSALFGLSVNGEDFTVVIIVGVGVAVLAGLTILGNGENQESIHILFMGGMLLGIWVILISLDGFLSGSPTSFFAQLNAWDANTGSVLFGFLSILYTMGIIGTISRGSV